MYKYLTIIIVLLSLSGLYSQDDKHINSYFITGTRQYSLDTLALQKAQEVSKESAGLLEKEIDPTKYLLGPGDVFKIMALGAKTFEVEAVISPEGKLLISDIGSVNLKGKYLSEADSLIKDKVSKIFKSQSIFVVLSKIREFKVIVSGAVLKPGIVPATAVDRVSEVIEKVGGFKYDASIRKISLFRDNEKVYKPVDLLKFYMTGDRNANPTLTGGDHIIVPTSSEKESIEIYGDVASPGKFEFVEGDSLSTLIRFAQGFLKSSLLDSVEIARFIENTSIVNRWFVDLSSWKNIITSQSPLPGDFPLHSGDRVFVRQIRDWNNDRVVAITGEVNYPGYYAINKDDTRVRDVIERAGGYTNLASPESSILIRQKEIQKSDPQMDRLSRTPYSEMSDNERRYFQARISEKKGLMALDFKKIMSDPKSEDNILLIDQDSIFVPQKKNFINIQGRVNNPGMVLFNPAYSWLDYINQAGGFGFRADDNETLIVKPKGEQYLASDMKYIIEPGDNILVPPKSEVKFVEVFTTSLTIAAQLLTIVGVIMALRRF